MATFVVPEDPRTTGRVASHEDRSARARGRRSGGRRIGSHVLLVVLAIYFVIPIWWLFVASTKTTPGLFSSPAFWFADNFAFFENVAGLFAQQGGIYWTWLGNSFIYAFAGGIGATILAILAGYGFAKYRFRGRSAIFTIILGSVMVPLTALVIPTFILLSQYGIINTPWAVILPSLLSPFGVYLMRVYTQDAVPDEMLEAARIDGAGEIRTFFQVALPLLRPARACSSTTASSTTSCSRPTTTEPGRTGTTCATRPTWSPSTLPSTGSGSTPSLPAAPTAPAS